MTGETLPGPSASAHTAPGERKVSPEQMRVEGPSPFSCCRALTAVVVLFGHLVQGVARGAAPPSSACWSWRAPTEPCCPGAAMGAFVARAVTTYDTIGATYRSTRRADPRIAAHIHAALDDTETVINVGAGAGSYEPVLGQRRLHHRVRSPRRCRDARAPAQEESPMDAIGTQHVVKAGCAACRTWPPHCPEAWTRSGCPAAATGDAEGKLSGDPVGYRPTGLR